MSNIKLENLSKTFKRRSGEVVRAIDDVSVEIESGEFLVILGPSGCGKTTLLRSIAGLEVPTEGRIVVDDRTIFDSDRRIDIPPEQRHMGIVFQSYALWPHLTVGSNVAYPLRMRGFPKSDISERVTEALDLVGIGNLLDQYPGQISGGQQQRTALARALVGGSSVVLFDEPLSNVDAKVREQLRVEIRRMHEELGFTALYVTHDQEEAMSLGSRVAVMHSGRIEQIATPHEVYQRPSSLTVGRFIGTLNEFEGRIEAREGDLFKVSTPIGPVYAKAVEDLAPGDEVVLGFRPEAVELVDPSRFDPDLNGWKLAPEISFFLGPFNLYVFSVEGVEFEARQSASRTVAEGSLTGVQIDPAEIYLFSRPSAVGSEE